jgi:hypothetical protein
MTTQQQIAAFLVTQGIAPPADRFASYYLPPTGALLAWRYEQTLAPEELARELLGIAEFRALQLGAWLGTADGEIITKAVESVMPPYLRADTELLVAGLKLAARLQRDQKGQRIAEGVALAILVAFVLVALNSRGGKAQS